MTAPSHWRTRPAAAKGGSHAHDVGATGDYDAGAGQWLGAVALAQEDEDIQITATRVT